MRRIFIDLEFCETSTAYKRQRKISQHEVIEVGAVMLNKEHEIISRFDRMVRPKYGEINEFITDLTGITNEMVSGADTYEAVMDEFLEWVGEDCAKVYSWSNMDITQLQRESEQKKYSNMRLEHLYKNWVDFQKKFGQMLGVRQAISLDNAVNGAGILFEGREHCALADAENTARLFQLTQDKDEFDKTADQIRRLVNPKETLTVNLGAFFTPDMLEQLNVG
ncbi:3'-5' exonuclease [Hespellia stercorisuis]|uniref:Inhibitor of the KinA pathway to sporulation, predicted exonuclease n=1 Tax=Hespellia stercorisuis DSM 15480 TaxID=1121950 RepID=A0A1M6UU79_9FIRM|nr:3'-5' exonuclease [Hespellia stercorisuis]SHK72606.1 Inhibitor of the KinA pathway to sporulation, predicted exonuclease [Hespellia stercorisuis DSM 15480]